MISPLKDPLPSLCHILLALFSINLELLIPELHIINGAQLVNVLLQNKTLRTRVVTHHFNEGNKNSKKQLDEVTSPLNTLR